MPQAWQTDVAETISTTHFEGSPAEPISELRSERVAQVVIPAGRLVVPGTAAHQLKLPTSAAEVTKAYGVSILMPLKSESGTDFAINEPVLFCEDGVVWVVVEEAVADGDPVLARHTANGGNTVLGRFRTTADTGASALPAARFRSASVTFGSLLLAKLKFDLPATA
jgi:hypothetical protein